MPRVATVSRNDIQRAEQMMRENQSFLCKLHGSISDVRSTVFTSSDYKRLLADAVYKTFLERILATATVIFIGYGVQDDYVLSMMVRNWNISRLFGDGPHFAILPDNHTVLPPSIRLIHYRAEPHKDHRSVISVVEEIQFLKNRIKATNPIALSKPDIEAVHAISSAHLLFDILPPGSWKTSQSLIITDPVGNDKQVTIGTGFSDVELPDNRSTAMHDVLVGLLCFDHVYAPISALSRVHNLLESQRFWYLVEKGILSFIKWDSDEGVIFPSADSISGGDLASFTVSNPDHTERTLSQIIQEHLTAIPGKEGTAERLFSILTEKTHQIKNEEGPISDMVRSLLLRPSIRQLIGVSGGMPLNSITRWNTFPILRLANVVKLGTACRLLKIGSIKLNFGAAGLAGPAFAATLGAEWADNTASYVLAGKFSADLGALVIQNPSILDKIIAFRETRTGDQLRQEVLAKLLANDGAEVNVSINGGLRNAVPSNVLQDARDDFVRLIVPTKDISCSTVIWNDIRYAENALMRWRQRSRQVLDEIISKHNFKPYDLCPCGSGEKIKFCCLEALSQ